MEETTKLDLKDAESEETLNKITKIRHSEGTPFSFKQKKFSNIFFQELKPIFTLAKKYVIDSTLAFKLEKDQEYNNLQGKFLQREMNSDPQTTTEDSQIMSIIDSPKKQEKFENPLNSKVEISPIQFKKIKRLDLFNYFFTTFKPSIKISLICTFFTSFSSILILLLYKIFLDEIETQIKASENRKLQNKSIVLFYIFLIVFWQALNSLIETQKEVLNSKINKKVKTTTYSLIYNKILKIDFVNSKKINQGKMINLFQSDVQEFNNFMWLCSTLVHSLTKIIFGLVLGFYIFGFYFTVVIFPLVIFSFWNKKIFESWGKLNGRWKSALDKRIKLLKEILSNINFIKSWVLENNFFKKLEILRLGELKVMISSTLLIMGFTSISVFGEIFSTLIFLLIYFFTGNILNVGKMTVLIRSLGIMGRGIKNIGNFIGDYKAMKISCKRIEDFLMHDEYFRENLKIVKNEEIDEFEENYVLEIIDGDFQWTPEESSNQDDNQEEMGLISEENRLKFRAQGINLKLKERSLNLLVGKIGAGKSTVLYGILGEAQNSSGKSCVFVKEGKTLCYLSQNPWIVNGTVEENIKLGTDLEIISRQKLKFSFDKHSEFDLQDQSQRLEYAITYSCLKEDLSIFGKEMANKSKTEINEEETPLWVLGLKRVVGESGMKLSGGQRARIALARCLYQNCDIFILDDILSALDNETASFIFKETFMGVLQDKTILVVTHCLDFLKYSDNIFVMKDGEIIKEGDYEEVMDDIGPEHFGLEKQVIVEKKKEQKLEKEEMIEEDMDEEKKADDVEEMMIKNERETGNLSFKLFALVAKYMGGATSLLILLLISFAESSLFQYSNIYGVNWARDFNETQNQKYSHLIRYCLLYSISTFGTIAKCGFAGYISYKLSKRLHRRMSFTLLNAKVQKYLSRLSQGVILNRFSGDIGNIDHTMHDVLPWGTGVLFELLTTIFVIYYTMGYTALTLTFSYLTIVSKAQNEYLRTYREYNRLANSESSPIISIINDTIEGLPSIRNTPGLLKKFKEDFKNQTEKLIRLELMQTYLSNWFELRLNSFIPLMIELPCLLYVVFSEINLAKIAIFTLKTMDITRHLKDMVHIRNVLDSAFVAVERCNYFIEKIEVEDKNWNKPQPMAEEDEETALEFLQVSAKYITSNELILKKLTFRVMKGERIGIVGRTGSGKSSLFKLLWRYLEIDSGKLFIGGIDSKKLSVQEMRKKFQIITQETSLFNATLRENIDIKGEFKEREIMRVLETLKFENKTFYENGLEMKIGDQGKGLSEGEKQLISFARCVLNLRKSKSFNKILLLDEYTAKIDMKTEKAIQMVLFGEDLIPINTTVLVIAHRLNTLQKCDKVLVLSHGDIVEFGKTENVITDKKVKDIEELAEKYE